MYEPVWRSDGPIPPGRSLDDVEQPDITEEEISSPVWFPEDDMVAVSLLDQAERRIAMLEASVDRFKFALEAVLTYAEWAKGHPGAIQPEAVGKELETLIRKALR